LRKTAAKPSLLAAKNRGAFCLSNRHALARALPAQTALLAADSATQYFVGLPRLAKLGY
jgi:hypothetical protein